MSQKRVLTALLSVGVVILVIVNINNRIPGEQRTYSHSWLKIVEPTVLAPNERVIHSEKGARIDPFELDSLLFQPKLLRVWDDTLYVYDEGIGKVYSFDADGKFSGSYVHGFGDGPSEVRNGQGLAITKNRIYLLDDQLRRLSWFARDGELLGSSQYEFMSFRLDVGDAPYIFAFDGPDAIVKTDSSGKPSRVFGSEIREQGTLIDVTGELYYSHATNTLVYISLYASMAFRYSPTGEFLDAIQLVHHRPFPYTTASKTAEGNLAFRAPPMEGYARDAVFHDGKLYVNTSYRNPVSESYIDIYDEISGTYIESIRVTDRISQMAWLGEGLIAIRVADGQIISISF